MKKVAEAGGSQRRETRGKDCGPYRDPRRKVVIVPGCHIDSMRQEENAYFFEDGDELIGMIVEGGTVEYQPADHTYVVRLTNGQHTAV